MIISYEATATRRGITVVSGGNIGVGEGVCCCGSLYFMSVSFVLAFLPFYLLMCFLSVLYCL